jgi:hypothetical protein
MKPFQGIHSLFTVLRPAQKFFTWRLHTRAAKFRTMLGAQGIWAGRDLYRATPAVTRDLGFSGLLGRIAPISRLLRHMGMWRIFSNPDAGGGLLDIPPKIVDYVGFFEHFCTICPETASFRDVWWGNCNRRLRHFSCCRIMWAIATWSVSIHSWC